MKFNKVAIGITNRCNAHCFTCNREVLTNYKYNAEMDFNLIESIVKQSNEMIYIGEMGDFIFHPQSLEIAEMTINKHNVKMRTDTNGNYREDGYWIELAKITHDSDSNIRFMIDDLSNDLHRIGTNSELVLHNLETFINAGGNAHVKTILFDFNYKKIDDMTKKFKSMGVKQYVTIKSRTYQPIGPLSSPPDVKSTLEICDTIFDAKRNPKVSECPWGKYKMCYINEYGELKVCCHLVFEGLVFADDIDEFIGKHIGKTMFDDLLGLYHKNKDLINLNNTGVTMESAWNNEFNQTLINNPNNFKICKYRCNLPNTLKDKLLYDTIIF